MPAHTNAATEAGRLAHFFGWADGDVVADLCALVIVVGEGGRGDQTAKKQTCEQQSDAVLHEKASSALHLFPTSGLPYFLAPALAGLRAPPFFALSRRSSTAATMMGSPTVASTKTSPNFPPSDAGTNLPQEIASL